MELNATKAQQGRNIQLIEIRKLKRDFESSEDYLIFKDELISKTIHPWLMEAYQHDGSNVEVPNGIWALIACELVDGAITTTDLIAFAELDYGMISEASSFDGITGFNEWVAHFKPISWGDWLMVPKLYLMHLRTGRNLSTLAAKPDPWIDAVLRESRGILMWSNQLTDICRMIGGVGSTEIAKIRRVLSTADRDWQDTLRSIHYSPTNQTLLEIFEERTLGIEYLQHTGHRDYMFANWLYNYFHQATRMDV